MEVLTQREKELERAIDSCGIPLNEFENTESCVRDVMRRIGASAIEHDFVKARVAVRVRTAEVLERTDAFINDTETMLDRLDQEMKEWDRKYKEFRD